MPISENFKYKGNTPTKDRLLPSSNNQQNNAGSEYDTAKINYTAIGYGNDHGSLTFGPVSYTHLTLPTIYSV